MLQYFQSETGQQNMHTIADLNFDKIRKVQYCKSKCEIKFLICFDMRLEKYRILCLSKMKINQREVSYNDGFLPLENFDQLMFPCQMATSSYHQISNCDNQSTCWMPHFFHVVYPDNNQKPEQLQDQDGLCLNGNSFLSIMAQLNRKPKFKYEGFSKMFQNMHSEQFIERPINFGEWTLTERETFKRYFLIFGYSRWQLIRDSSKNSGCNIEEKADEEMILYANSFIQTIISQLKNQETKEVKEFLSNLIEENQFEATLDSNLQMWGGESFVLRAQQWGKRIQLLYVVTRIVRAYKEKRRTFLASDSQDKLDQRLYKAYKLKENLLNFISNDQLVGMKPAQWWTRRFDIDLILGTHKWGYGNYQVMREDQKLSYCKNPKNDPYYQFPQAEQVTKRLKKLVQLISRVEGEFDFDGQIKLSEHSGFNLEEKNAIVEVVCDIGIPIGSDETKKSDFQHIRNRASMILNRIMTQPDHKIEKFLNFIQSECQKLTTEYSGHLQRIGYKDLNKELNDYKVLKPKQLRLDLFENQGQELYFKTDDEDDFRVTIDIAFKINKRVALFNLIRKIIMSNQNQLFDACIDDLTELIIEEREKDECYLPVDWLVGIHDRGLLNAISERGVSYLKQAKQEHEFGLYAITISSKKLLRRVEFLCHYFKTLPQRGQILNPERQSAIKASMLSIQNKPTQKIKINIDSDANGNIKYPIEINQSLKILNLGYIDNERQNYHSHRNLFPIGFKTIRTHQSLFNLGARAEYICEILDGGERPLFKVTPAEEPDKPIIKDSTSGCWLEIVKRIESMTNIRKGKVTVSGPDRYGLQEPAVMQLIQQLPNADKCQRYQFR